MGAEVIRLTGLQRRRSPPARTFSQRYPDKEKKRIVLYLNTNKYGITLTHQPAGKEVFPEID